ncbi:putative MFS family arabinose efflux permease [Phycicoccus duodecadis]|uniref:Putative MFS family arabinose efflux permease n=2 Tax=Phycicoccus duodecadis TaxID=173053 RepID=A0A2N3YH32_9MICO|nr:putative MFS family arabinose efflux permease [Phycicoccus duodecadis]
MSLFNQRMSVMQVLVAARVVNRLGGAGMAFLGVRMTRDLGVSLPTAGTVLAVFGLCTIPSRVLGGVVTTRWGPRAALVGGLAAAGGAQAVVAAGDSLAVVALGVVLLGLAYEVVEPATSTAVLLGVEPERRASRFSLLWACVAVAGVVAGVVAALVTRWGVGALFAVDAATSLGAAALVAVLLPRLAPARGRTAPRPWRAALGARLLAWTALCSVSCTVVMLVVLMLPVALDRAGHPPSVAALLMALSAAAALVGQRLLARWEARVRASVVLAVGYGLLGTGLAAWAAGGLSALLLGAVLDGAASSLVVGTQQAVASRLVAPGAEAAVMTVQGLSWGVATVAAPLLGAALLARGPAVLWLSAAAVCLALAAGHAAPRGATRGRRGQIFVSRV